MYVKPHSSNPTPEGEEESIFSPPCWSRYVLDWKQGTGCSPRPSSIVWRVTSGAWSIKQNIQFQKPLDIV